MMKWMKKIATLALAIALIVPCFSMVSHAANSIQFDDPSTAVGETLDLLGVIKTDRTTIEDRTIVMTYDTTMLKFQSGDNVTETTPGELKYEVLGQENSSGRIEFHMSFIALKEGTTKVEVKESKIYSTSDAALTYTPGTSTIKIAAGDPSKIPTDTPVVEEPGTSVEAHGGAYTISQEFKESDIPAGFEEAVFEYDGTNYKSITIPGSDLNAVYLVNGDSEGRFFVYNNENGAFYPLKYVEISDVTSIVILEPEEKVTLPAPYEKNTLSYEGEDGYAYTIWENRENTTGESNEEVMCIVYAMTLEGEKVFYQFDADEMTYQRFDVPTVVKAEKEGLIAKISNKLGSPMDLIVFGGIFLIVLIVIIVLSVKLYNRNAELDELYDEYGIDLFDDDEEEDNGNKVVRIDDDEDFEEIDYGTEDDIVIEGIGQEEELPEDAIEEQLKAQPEEQPEQLGGLEEFIREEPETMEEAMKTLAAAVQSDEAYWNDDSEDDFEMSFIDLDD